MPLVKFLIRFGPSFAVEYHLLKKGRAAMSGINSTPDIYGPFWLAVLYTYIQERAYPVGQMYVGCSSLDHLFSHCVTVFNSVRQSVETPL